MGRKPNISHLKIFGNKAYFLNKISGKRKFEARLNEGFFVGYSNDSKAYCVWNPESKKIVKSKDIKFIEKVYISQNQQTIKTLNLEQGENEILNKSITKEEEISVREFPKENKEILSDQNQEASNEVDDQQVKRGPGRSKIIRTSGRSRPKKQYASVSNAIHEANLMCSEDANPTEKEALAGPYSKEWKRAMKIKFDALIKNGAWKLVQRPRNKNVIGCQWVLRTKFRANGTTEKRKACLVAKGCCQLLDIDFHETFSPVTRLSSIRLIVALSAQLKLDLYQLDMVTAYVNGDLEEEIYMEQANGFTESGGKDMVYSLQRSLYDLKQSGRQWFEKFDK